MNAANELSAGALQGAAGANRTAKGSVCIISESYAEIIQ